VTEQWGRVDDEGTVYVRTSAGERVVGSYQAGSAEEALAYYGRKYAALEVEVDLLERRVASPEVAPEEVLATLARVRAAVAEAHAVGDLDALTARLDALVPRIEDKRSAARAEREAARAQAREHRERIVAEAEELAVSEQWKVAGDRLRTLLEEWKVAPHVDRGTEQALWKRFSAARNAFDRRRRHHFAHLAAHQDEAKAVKARLVTEAEALATSTDWGPTAARFRALMDEWRVAGRAARADDDALWARFRAAQDAFFAARSAEFSARDAGQAANLAAKEALAAEAEALLPVTHVASARAALRAIEERWEQVGHVPRADRDRVEGRLRRVEEAVRSAEETRWRRSNPEARARARDAVDQLTAGIQRLERDLERARISGDERAIAAAEESLAAKRTWLEQAERALAEFGG
jgi:hypothetical protein